MLEHPQHAEAIARGADCTACPLYGCKRGPVPSSIVVGSLLSAAGEGPGEDEVALGYNFAGWSGAVVDESLLIGGVDRSATTVINTIACRQDEKRSLEEYLDTERRRAKREGREWRSPIDCCRPRFEADLDEAGSRVVLAIGKAALAATERWARARQLLAEDADDLVMARVHGAPIALADGRWLFGSYHPARASKGREPKWFERIRSDMARAARVAVRGWIDWSEPNYVVDPPVELALTWLQAMRAIGSEITIDLETCDAETGKPSADVHTCDVRCVGFGFIVNGHEHVVVIPFRHMDGTPWRSDNERARLFSELRATFDACALAGHNFVSFDSEVMLRLGLLSARGREHTDTLLLHHDTREQDMPHSLSYVGRALFEVPAWKSKEDLASTDNADDHRLSLRCGRDVVVTMRALPHLREQVSVSGTVSQYGTDVTMSRVLRDMGELGLVVDEVERGKMSALLGAECRRLEAEFQAAAGYAVNPRSPPQLADLFYSRWGYDPVLKPDGEEWHEEDDAPEDGSTGAAAILALLDVRPVEAAHKAALELLLEYKALDKPRSVYVDSLPVRELPGAWPMVQAEGALDTRPIYSWVRPTWTIGRVPTGRANCKQPGEQQRPKRGRRIILPDGTVVVPNMRKIIRAYPGHKIVGADQKQLEARLYTASSGDLVLWDAIQRKLDIHSLNAATLLAERESDIPRLYQWLEGGGATAEEREYWRYVAKKFVFGIIYGAQAKKLFEVMRAERIRETGKRAFPHLRLADCEVWEERWHRGHPWTERWQRKCYCEYRERGFANSEILDCRRRFAPLEENQIPNMRIQAGGAAIKNRAAVAIDSAIPHRSSQWSEWSGLIIDGHDYLAVQVPEARAEEAAAIIREANRFEWNGMQFEGSPKISDSWGDQ